MISVIVTTVYFGNQRSLDEALIPALAISSAALALINYSTTISKGGLKIEFSFPSSKDLL